MDSSKITRREQLDALLRACRYRPVFSALLIVASLCAALLEAVGLSFIVPIVEVVQAAGDPVENADGILLVFVKVYDLLNIPLTLGYIVAGVSVVLTIRWVLTFGIRWARSILVIDYNSELKKQSFENAIDARLAYFDRKGSDDILNAIVTQTAYASKVLTSVVNFVEQGLLTMVYFAIAFYLAPLLTLFALALLGGFFFLFRVVLESGYDIGERLAAANERIQASAQAGTQGIRDTKLFNLKAEMLDDFAVAVDQYLSDSILQKRNREAIENFYNLLTAVSVFLLIYLAISFANMSLGSLSMFLFAMFRLGPKASALNSKLYSIQNSLPHLVRAHRFIDGFKQYRESNTATEPVPETVETIEFSDVHFSYETQDEKALSGISLQFDTDEFIGFVGESGAGKSTIVSLLARMYEPDSGTIRANGRSIHDMDIDEWREQVAVVRQDPFIFNETLRYNLTIGNRDATQAQLDRVSRIACIDNFMDELPDGYDTELGDNGVRLSGGQRQRVALARALIKDADILILDEATSNLDTNLEQEVQESIESMERDYAIIGIAHRLSTIRNADRIYTVDSGEIVEVGTHEELLENGQRYAQLYGIQSQG